MLTFYRSEGSRYCDGMTRRDVLRVGSLGWGGLTLPGLLRLGEATAAEPGSRLTHRARSVIILYLSGGPSQLDMWDMKPSAPEEIRGTFQPIKTNVPEIQVCEHMPRMARLADKYTIIRSMSHHEGDHLRAGYCAMTGGFTAAPGRTGIGHEPRRPAPPRGGAGEVPGEPIRPAAVRDDPRIHFAGGGPSARPIRGLPRRRV